MAIPQFTAGNPLTAAELNVMVNQINRVGGEWTRVANQLVSPGSFTQVLFDTELTDPDGFLTPSSGVATIPADLGGLYAITAMVQYATAALGVNAIRIGISSTSGPPVAAARTYDFTGNTLAGFQVGSLVVPLFAAQTITISSDHNNAGNQNLTGYLAIHRVGM